MAAFVYCLLAGRQAEKSGKRLSRGCTRLRAQQEEDTRRLRDETAGMRAALGYRRHRMDVMYDGTEYKGWQLQKNTNRTVQSQVEDALRVRYQELVRVVAASRTDTGVHARGQVVHMDLPPGDYDLDKTQFALNRLLPEDVRIKSISVAPPPDKSNGFIWNAMHSSVGKHYTYKLCLGRLIEPTDRLYRALEFRPIDVAIFNDALQKTVGTHDFAGFASGPVTESKIRTLKRVVLKEDLARPGYYEIDFLLSGALYKMLRNIVGTSLRIAMGAASVDVVDEILGKTGRHPEKRCAQSKGLCLERVFYSTDLDLANVAGGLMLPQGPSHS